MTHETAIKLRNNGFPYGMTICRAIKKDGTILMEGDKDTDWVEIPTDEQLALEWLKLKNA